MPRVSVIVPAYNYGHFLPETLDSVLAQTLADWECIVVDDGSTDDTRDVAHHYGSLDSRFVYLYQNNKGLSEARNAGLGRASGVYIQLLDADDLIETEKLRNHVAFLDSEPDIDVVIGAARYFKTGPGGQRKRSARRDITGEEIDAAKQGDRAFLLHLIEKNLFPVSAPVLRRRLVEEIGFFDDTLRSHEDWDFWLRIALAGKRFAFLDSQGTATLIREHERGLTGKQVAMGETRLAVRRRIEAATREEELLTCSAAAASYDQCILGAAYFKNWRFPAAVQITCKGFCHAESKVHATRLFLANLAPGWLLEAYRSVRNTFTNS